MALFLESNFPEQGSAFVFRMEADTLGDRDYYYYYYYFAHGFQHPWDMLQAREHTRAFHRQTTGSYLLLLLSNRSKDSLHPRTSSEKLLPREGERAESLTLIF